MGNAININDYMKSFFDVMYLPLDETTGTTANDLSSNNIDCDYVNCTVGDIDSPFVGKKAPKFLSASSSRIPISEAAWNAVFPQLVGSVSMWIKPLDITNVTDAQYFLGAKTTTITVFSFYIQTNLIINGVYLKGNSKYIGKNDWIHIVQTWDKAENQVKSYYNGNLWGAIDTDWADFSGTFSTGNLRPAIGAQLGSGYAGFNGWITHFGLSSRCLTASEVQKIYRSPYEPALGLFGVGDSKMYNNWWFDALTEAMTTADSTKWLEKPIMYGVGGADITSIKNGIDAKLATVIQIPSKIIVNVGTNDARPVTITSEAIFKEDYSYVLDALISKWPGVPIYCARIWRGDSAQTITNSAIISGYIDDLITLYAAQGVLAGHDERVWVEGGDAGATMLQADKVHYSAAGGTACVTQWMTAMGY